MNSEPLPDTNAHLVNIDAEKAIIGSIFVYENATWERIGDDLKPEHFGSSDLAEIFGTCLDFIAEGKKPNPVTLRGRFPNDLMERLLLSATTPINAGEYARLIVDLWAKRTLIGGAEGAIQAAGGETSAVAAILEDALETATEKTGDAIESQEEQVEAALAEIEAAHQGKIDPGLSTGLPSLDEIIGGMKPGQLIIIGARTAMGKTSLAVKMADQGLPTALFELEMTATDIHTRRLSYRTGVPFWAISRGKMHNDQADRVFEEGSKIKASGLHVDDTPGQTVAAIRRRARRMKRKHKIALLVIDHLQLVRHQRPRGNTTAELGEIVKDIKELAKELDVPVILLSQLSRAVDSRDDHRPTLADLRQTGEIEEAADIVMFVFREEYYLQNNSPTMRDGEKTDSFADRAANHEAKLAQASGRAEVIVAKNRNGACKSVTVRFNAQTMRFYEDSDQQDTTVFL